MLDASNVASFAGPMRTNMVTMLEGVGLHERLGIDTVDDLFADRTDLLHSTSALLYPVFHKGQNYSGSPEPARFEVLQAFVDQVLAAELQAFPSSLVIPLGRCVEGLLRNLVDKELLDGSRVLFGFPHPSGGNGHRARIYEENRPALASQIAAWSTPAPITT